MSEQDADFRDTLYTVDQHGNRKWVYPQPIEGKFYRARKIVMRSLMAILFVLPWTFFDGEQTVLLDIRNRKFTFFGTTFWATDTFYLMLVLGCAGLSLFFFTSLFGRIWCGWACPETVFLEFLFRPIEALIEGNANKRRQLDQSKWTARKILIKATKYGVFLFISWFIASTLLAYFFGREPLLAMMTHSPTENPTPFIATLFLTFVITFQFGWFREQFCTVLCPYARFQSVLLDSDSLVIGYDKTRGEPRGKANKDSSLGDCVDCNLCVRVCPTGIDIRNGLQLECIQCASCIDACHSIMTKLGKKTGLIRYDTENRFAGKKLRFIRPRVLVYGTILSVYITSLLFSLSFRKTAEFQILRSPGEMPYADIGEGKITNHFKIHLANKGKSLERFEVRTSASDVNIILPGSPYPLSPGAELEVPLFIETKKSSLIGGKREITLTVSSEAGEVGTQKLKLLGPG